VDQILTMCVEYTNNAAAGEFGYYQLLLLSLLVVHK